MARQGILAARGHERKFVWQSVHMIFEGQLAEPWAVGERRMSRMVLIGVQLDAKELSQQFRGCLPGAAAADMDDEMD